MQYKYGFNYNKLIQTVGGIYEEWNSQNLEQLCMATNQIRSFNFNV